jgi:ABC-type transport system involved in cytochrome bd biosynthesis fused ATPase/permease subunit
MPIMTIAYFAYGLGQLTVGGVFPFTRVFFILVLSFLVYGLTIFVTKRYHKQSFIYRIQNDFLESCLSDTNSSSNAAQYIQKYFPTIVSFDNLFWDIIPQLLGMLSVYLIFILLTMRRGQILLAFLPLIIAILIGSIRYLYQKNTHKHYHKQSQSFHSLGQRFIQELSGMATLLNYNAEKNAYDKFKKESEDYRVKTMNVLKTGLSQSLMTRLLIYGGLSLMAYQIYRAYQLSILPLGESLYLVTLIFPVILNFSKLSYVIRSFSKIRPTMHMIFQTIENYKQKLEKSEHLKHTEYNFSQIKVKNLTVSQDKKDILRQVDLSFEEGQFIAIVGHSGSGKSTLLQALVKRQPLNEGLVTYDNVHLDAIPSTVFNENVSYLSSTPYLFNGTIADNIKLYNLNQTHLETWLKDHHLCEFVWTLDEGLKTIVGEGGKWLSRGQKQQIILARQL